MTPPVFRVGDLVKIKPVPGRYIPNLNDGYPGPGIVVKILHEGSYNEALRVIFAGSRTVVRPRDEFEIFE